MQRKAQASMYHPRTAGSWQNARSGLSCLDAWRPLFASDMEAIFQRHICMVSGGQARRNGYNNGMPKSSRSAPVRTRSPRYTEEHASAGLDYDFPEIETWPNQFPGSRQSGYEIVVDDPEFTSVCPKTGLPDFGQILIRYEPDRLCLELKSLKEYLQSYRNLGIFQENIVNRVLEDVVLWAKPVWAEVKGEFRPRGGISTVVIAKWPKGKRGKR
jgi:7-cyano-7-deazaguanine reductase